MPDIVDDGSVAEFVDPGLLETLHEVQDAVLVDHVQLQVVRVFHFQVEVYQVDQQAVAQLIRVLRNL